MTHEAGDELRRDLAQSVRSVADEGVLVVAPEREVRVHARTLHVGERLGHEARRDVGLARQLLHDVSHRHHGVAHREGVGVAQVDLVLSGRVLVLGVLDADAHLFERQYRSTSQLTRGVIGQEVEVTAAVDRHRGDRRVEAFEVEVLDLGRDEERVTLGAGLAEDASQLLARAAVEGRAVDVDDVTKDPRHAGALFVPGEELERREVRSRASATSDSLGAREAVDGAAVKGHALVEGVLEFGRRDVKGLVATEHVGEPQLDEANAAFLHGSQYVLGLTLHR